MDASFATSISALSTVVKNNHDESRDMIRQMTEEISTTTGSFKQALEALAESIAVPIKKHNVPRHWIYPS